MVHQRGLVCVLLLIVPDSSRSFAGVSDTTTVPMTFQLLKNCSLTLTIHYLNAFSITQRTSYTPSFTRNLNNIQPARKATQLLYCREDFRTERTLRVICTKTVISSFSIFHSFYIRCCVLSTGFSTRIYDMIWWWYEVDRTTAGGDMAIWNFSKMAAAAILDLFEPKIAPLDPPSLKNPH